MSRFATLLRRLGIQPEQRILLCLHDTIDFPTAFLGAIKAGIVPVPVNTQLAADDFAFMLADSRARAVVVSEPVWPVMQAALAALAGPQPEVIVSGAVPEQRSLSALLAESARPVRHRADPPGRALLLALFVGLDRAAEGGGAHPFEPDETAELYAIPVLGIAESDIVFSAAKLFLPMGSAMR